MNFLSFLFVTIKKVKNMTKGKKRSSLQLELKDFLTEIVESKTNKIEDKLSVIFHDLNKLDDFSFILQNLTKVMLEIQAEVNHLKIQLGNYKEGKELE